jgi:hypothetical protein
MVAQHILVCKTPTSTKQGCWYQAKKHTGRPNCLVSLSALKARLLCFTPTTSTCFSSVFIVITNITNINNKTGGTCHEPVYINEIPRPLPSQDPAKPFTAAIKNIHNKLVFIPSKTFQSTLIFVGKYRSLH